MIALAFYTLGLLHGFLFWDSVFSSAVSSNDSFKSSSPGNPLRVPHSGVPILGFNQEFFPWGSSSIPPKSPTVEFLLEFTGILSKVIPLSFFFPVLPSAFHGVPPSGFLQVFLPWYFLKPLPELITWKTYTRIFSAFPLRTHFPSWSSFFEVPQRVIPLGFLQLFLSCSSVGVLRIDTLLKFLSELGFL